VTPQQAWMLASPGSGTTSQTGQVQVRVDRELGASGPRSGQLMINSDAGSAVVSVVVE
jgi:hypothetical protein